MRYPTPFQTAALFLILCGWVAIALSSCGSPDTDPRTTTPFVNIQCDTSSCTILVHDADTITTFHDGEFYWSEDVVPPGRRYTNRDRAPKNYLKVRACNERGCTDTTHEVL